MNESSAGRRQQFIDVAYARAQEGQINDSIRLWGHSLPANGESLEHRRALAAANVADNRFQLLALRYTAGDPIEPMREALAEVIAAHEAWRDAKRLFEADPDEPAFYFAQIAQYERCVQLIGLCYLLHRRDLLPCIARLQDPGYAGQDALYEELLDYELPDRFNTDALYHPRPFSRLVEAMFRKSEAQSLADLQAYCTAWYPAMCTAPWHDGHLRMTDTDGDYFGYWAFEAGAVAYLLDLDDSGIDHLVYPKDLVRFAREFGANGKR